MLDTNNEGSRYSLTPEFLLEIQKWHNKTYKTENNKPLFYNTDPYKPSKEFQAKLKEDAKNMKIVKTC